MLHRAATALVLALLGLTVSACGDDEPPDIDGVWNVTSTVVSGTCGNPPGDVSNDQFEIAQDGEEFTVTIEPSATLNGRFDGDEFEIEGSFTQSEAGCTARIEIEGSGTASSTRLSGNFTQEISIVSGACPPAVACVEDHSFVGTR